MVNSNHEKALVGNGGGTIDVRPNGMIGYVEGADYAQNGGVNTLLPPPVGDMAPVEDPYHANGVVPPAGPFDCSTYTCPEGSGRVNVSSDVTLSPGLYPGGLKITGGAVTFQSGLYLVDGMDVSGNATLRSEGFVTPPGDPGSATGVTFFNIASSSGLKNISIAGTVDRSAEPFGCGWTTAADVRAVAVRSAAGLPDASLTVNTTWSPNNRSGSEVAVAVELPFRFVAAPLVATSASINLSSTSRMTIW